MSTGQRVLARRLAVSSGVYEQGGAGHLDVESHHHALGGQGQRCDHPPPFEVWSGSPSNVTSARPVPPMFASAVQAKLLS